MNKDKEVESYLKGELPEEEKLKYEIAGELGLLDQVLEKPFGKGNRADWRTDDPQKKTRKIRKQKAAVHR